MGKRLPCPGTVECKGQSPRTQQRFPLSRLGSCHTAPVAVAAGWPNERPPLISMPISEKRRAAKHTVVVVFIIASCCCSTTTAWTMTMSYFLVHRLRWYSIDMSENQYQGSLRMELQVTSSIKQSRQLNETARSQCTKLTYLLPRWHEARQSLIQGLSPLAATTIGLRYTNNQTPALEKLEMR
jgi:hypothetical protein